MKAEYIRVIFGAFVLLLVTVCLIAYRNLEQYTNEVKWSRHSTLVLNTLEMIQSSMVDAETGHQGYQLTRDTSFLQPYYLSLEEMPENLGTLDSLLLGNRGQIRRLDTLRDKIKRHFGIIGEILKNEETNKQYMSREEIALLQEGKLSMREIRRLINEMIDAEDVLLDERVSSERDFSEIAPFTLLGYALFALAGATVLFTIVSRELNTRKKAERQLQQNLEALHQEIGIREYTQKSLRSVLESSLNGILTFRAVRNDNDEIVDFTYTMANSVGARYSGKSEKELIGMRLLELMPENKTTGLFDKYKEVVETGEPKKFEQLYQGEGLDNWFAIVAVKLDDGFVVTFSDITEEKKRALQMQEIQQLLNDAEEIAFMGSWGYDSSSKQMVWSEGMYDILQADKASAIPSFNVIRELVYHEDLENYEHHLTTSMKRREKFAMEFRASFDGNFRYLKLTGRPRKDIAGRMSGYLGTLEDVTEERLNTLRLQKQSDDLRRSNEDLEQFAYVASHDLQEPLRKIRAFGDRLESKYRTQLNGSGIDYIDRMQRSAARMQALIDDLLTYSRVSRSDYSFKIVDLNGLMEGIAEDFETTIDQEKATLEIQQLPAVSGDASQLKRLFLNLISNAIKFKHPDRDPHVTLAAEYLTKDEVEEKFHVSLNGDAFVGIHVKDNGIGFDEKYLSRIFNIFQRLHGRMEFKGTGIGLAICKKIATNHHGFVTATSQEDVGSDFIVVLPALDDVKP